MDIILFIIIALLFYGSRCTGRGFNNTFLSKELTTCVNGIFILFVFASHFSTYIDPAPWVDYWTRGACLWLGQLMVAPFLFFSGYGVMESIKAKGDKYISAIPKKRMLSTWFNFAVAISVFLLVNLIMGRFLPARQVILSYIGWDSIGNSNWYIFAIILLYFFTYVSFKLSKNKQKALLCLWALSILYCVVLSFFKPPHWYNTSLCYAFGATFSYFKNIFQKYVRNNSIYISGILLAVFVFIFFRSLFSLYQFQPFHQIMAFSFCVLIVFTTMKFRFGNLVLTWIGQRLFWVYILQRIPMMVLSNFSFFQGRQVVFMSTSLIITLVASGIFYITSQKMLTKLSQKSI